MTGPVAGGHSGSSGGPAGAADDTGSGERVTPGSSRAGGRAAGTLPSLFAELHQQQENPPGPPAAPVRPPPPDEPDTYSAEELAGAAGAEITLVSELKQYGLISPHAVVAGIAYYDESALAVTQAAAAFSRHGVEARHLRIWRNAADREADLFQQVVLPLLRQRNPQARRQAVETLGDLSAAGAALRAALVERAIREIR